MLRGTDTISGFGLLSRFFNNTECRNDAHVFPAQLTAVDGATVITHDLDAIGFGAKIKEAAENFEVVEIDPLDHEGYINRTPVEKIGGKRLQSAARFIYNQRDAIALVASQVGSVTAFVWEEYDDKPTLNGLHAYRRLKLTLF